MAVVVKGYKQFLRACDRAGKETKTEVRGEFRHVGDLVKAEWQQQFSAIDEDSAAGLRTRVRQRGVAVEQSRRRVTGLRRDYARLQVRYGTEALEAKAPEVERRMEKAIDRVADHFEKH